MTLLYRRERKKKMASEGCKCQGCDRVYKVDLLIPDYIWEKIKPAGKDYGAGLLCGSCIMSRIEDLGAFGAYKMLGT